MANTGKTQTELMDGCAKISGEYDLTTYYEDTDLSGYVYHANYLKFFERARSELISVEMVKELYIRGVHFVVAGANLRYKRPSLYGDKLTIKTNLEFTRSPKTVVYQDVYKDGNPKPVVTGEIELVLVNKEGKPVETPDFFFELIEKLSSN